MYKTKNHAVKFSNYMVAFIVLSFLSCGRYTKPNTPFRAVPLNAIDYSNIDTWAAHADKVDMSDKIAPGATLPDDTLVDVFFIHPTTYIGNKNEDQWNATIFDSKLNKYTDEGAILFQASAFNAAGKVYAPRYRQAHFHAYFTKDKPSAVQAFNLAFDDVKNSFKYYITFINRDKPFILAGHSQGTNHAERIIDEIINNDQKLRSRMVAAYLIGMPIRADRWENLKPCSNAEDTGCYISWRTFKRGYEVPPIDNSKILVTNPLSWSTDSTYYPKNKNKGALLKNFNKTYPQLVDAQAHNDILWASKPKFRGSFLLRTKNYHIADINFYYFNIRENLRDRIRAYFNK
jgi:hypothetical protein